jgi:hypothetical protein
MGAMAPSAAALLKNARGAPWRSTQARTYAATASSSLTSAAHAEAVPPAATMRLRGRPVEVDHQDREAALREPVARRAPDRAAAAGHDRGAGHAATAGKSPALYVRPGSSLPSWAASHSAVSRSAASSMPVSTPIPCSM